MITRQIWIPYCGVAPSPAELLGRWNFDPILIFSLGALALTYWLRFRNIEPWRRACFASALLLLVALFISPFCALTSALFSARVLHHVLIGVAVAPLIVRSIPASDSRLRGSLAAWTAAQALIFWLWHSPPLYALALSNHAAYWLMQLSLLASAVGFWMALRRASAPTAAAALLATTVQMGLLGALITFSASALYAPHFATTQAWGFSPLEDQQLAGLIMWAPAAGAYLAAALLLIGRWLSGEARLSSAS